MAIEKSHASADSLSAKVLAAVAEREGGTPTDLPTPLYDVIDPDALDSLFTAGAGRLVFPYCGYRITVSAGDVEVDESES